ncbi:RagB/SusD family nutrient uptake outer membrane protein [Longitalea luteola]|uniref:RagB/SusD family nutrient uptake outer membrane protein n=1 Tax=Longitalea luteola TaxID=2812563 RepID=UPI001A977FCB|nr:RagB/SusD family nutrient uptake outer membrane protein [Longitalea luteola]
MNSYNKLLIPIFNRIIIVVVCFLVVGFIRCKKLVEVSPPDTFLADGNVYNSDGTAIAVLTNLYATMSSESIFTGSNSMSLYTGLSSDEFTLFSGISSPDAKFYYYINSLYADVPSTTPGTEYWAPLYNMIFLCNSAIEGLSSTNKLTPDVKSQLLGEAKFLRAFYFFYLTNLYGDVPLALTTDYKLNSQLPRSAKSEVYKQLIADLLDAQTVLKEVYLDGTLLKNSSERLRPNKWAATALLARVYLYFGDWTNAEIQSSAVIGNNSLYSLSSLDNAFLKASKGNKEAIWQLQPVYDGYNTQDARVFIIPSSGPNDYQNPVFLSNQLLGAFEPADQRRYGKWVDSIKIGSDIYYFPKKYKIDQNSTSINEHLTILRLSEQYLIRAEARAQLNKIDDAKTDLNIVRNRSGLDNTNANSQASLLTAIIHEKQVELFSEFGHRWFDLKRTNNVDNVMTVVCPLKSNTNVWRSFQQLYPIPLTELQKAGQLAQNPGYE